MSRAGAAMWARADVRRRWRSLVVLGVLIGVTAGFAMAAFAGARRTDTAFARLRARTNASDAIVFGTQTQNFRIDPVKWAQLARQPEVKVVAPWVLAVGNVNGDDNGVIMGSFDGKWAGDVDRGVLVAGRRFNPRAVDEAVIEEIEAKHDHVRVGDVIHFQPYTLDQFVKQSGGPPAGPHLQIKVVGIVRTVQPYLFAGLVMMSPGVFEKYGYLMASGTNASVQLRHGSTDMAAFRSDVNRIIEPGTPILDLRETQRRVNTTLDVEGAASRLLALAVVLAGIVLAGQALRRSASAVERDAPVLRAMGMTRSAVGGAVASAHAVMVAIAVVIAFAMAYVTSRWFPVGLGGSVDPDRGFHVDWLVLGVGLPALIGVLFAATAWIGAGSARASTSPRLTRPSRVLGAVQQRASAPMSVGAALVVERRRVGGIPVREAMIGAVVGVLGLTATLTINGALRDALSHPERAGVHADAFIAAADSKPEGLSRADIARIAALPEVTASAVESRLIAPLNGIGVPAFSLDQSTVRKHGHSIAIVLLDGHAPRNDNEVVVGPATARQLHVHEGQEVTVGASSRVRVVGHALFTPDVHSEFDEGMWLTPAALDRAGGLKNDDARLQSSYVAVRLQGDKTTAMHDIQKRLGNDFGLISADPPDELHNLKNVRTLPIVLAIFLALLALAALLHVLTAIARERASDFAVLRAIGMTRRGTCVIVNVQGTLIAAVGIAIGVPIGILAGRQLWRVITERVPLTTVTPFAVVAIACVIVGTLFAANAVALWPGRRAARQHPAEVLHAE